MPSSTAALELFAANLVSLALAFLLDRFVGDPPSRFHPVVWMGWVIGRVKRANRGSPLQRRVLGVLCALAVIALFSLPVYFALQVAYGVSPLLYVLVACVTFKFTFAFRSMADYTKPIAERLLQGDLEGARAFIPYIARRDPSKLDEELITSTAVESIAESTVDGAASPLFYFALLGVPGAVAYRVVNTLDSMVGYKRPDIRDFGWFSAKLDTILNYVPARLTALLIAASAKLLRLNSSQSLRIALRDHSKTESLNAGWPMSAMAGALGVKLVKLGFYELGDPIDKLKPIHIIKALEVMAVTVALFTVICLPIILLRCMLLAPWVM